MSYVEQKEDGAIVRSCTPDDMNMDYSIYTARIRLKVKQKEGGIVLGSIKALFHAVESWL